MNTNTLWAIILIGVLIYLYNTPPTNEEITTTTTTEPIIPTTDYTSLIDAGVSFTGRNMYKTGTALSEEDVRVIKINEGKTDLGYFSLDSESTSIIPGVNYKFYFFMNTTPSPSYYVDVQDYVGKEQDATDPVFGEGCEIDTAPIFWVEDSGSRTQTATSNAESLAASATTDVLINIKVNSDKCYGTPDAIGKGMENVICFLYNSTPFSKVETNTQKTSIPSSIRISGNYTNKIANCYKFPVLQDLDKISIPVTLTASSTEPTTAHNITVMSEDICIDLNADNLEEIWGYEDEYLNNLGASALLLGTIYIS